jgi:sec-independent protein translocase protein TatA
MAQKNATNDLKSEIQKAVEANGFRRKVPPDMTGNIINEITKAKQDIVTLLRKQIR